MMKVLYQMCRVANANHHQRFCACIWIPRGHKWFLSQNDVREMYGGCYSKVGHSFNHLVDVVVTQCCHEVYAGETYLVIGCETRNRTSCSVLVFKMLSYVVVAAREIVATKDISA